MNRHHFILTKSISPIFGERASDQWENSLGMEFVYSSAQGLYVGRNEVRVSDFQAMHGTTPTGQFKGMVSVTKTGRVDAGRTWLEPGWEQTPEHPVIGLNWHDCVRYAEWLTGKERASGHLKPTQRYALPTTNEWFGFAGNSVYPWGNLISGLEGKYHVLNYSGTEAMRAENWPKDWPVLQSYYDAFEYTAPAGRMVPNALGLFHIGGNAAEWTADQVLCGSSWADGEAIKYADAWDRLELRRVLKEDADRRDDRFGFRLVIKEDAR